MNKENEKHQLNNQKILADLDYYIHLYNSANNQKDLFEKGFDIILIVLNVIISEM
jgi:hypothetical protein